MLFLLLEYSCISLFPNVPHCCCKYTFAKIVDFFIPLNLPWSNVVSSCTFPIWAPPTSNLSLQSDHIYAENGHANYRWSILSVSLLHTTHLSDWAMPIESKNCLVGNFEWKALRRQIDILGQQFWNQIILNNWNFWYFCLTISQAELNEKTPPFDHVHFQVSRTVVSGNWCCSINCHTGRRKGSFICQPPADVISATVHFCALAGISSASKNSSNLPPQPFVILQRYIMSITQALLSCTAKLGILRDKFTSRFRSVTKKLLLVKCECLSDNELASTDKA